MEGFFSKSQVTQHRAKPLLAPRCGSCGLYKRCKSPKMPLDGEGRKRILIVAEAPGADEDTQGKPLVGKTGQHLQRTLDYYGIDMRKDCWLTNSTRCRPENNAAPTDKQIAWCRPFLIRTIEEEIDPVVIIPLGGSAVASLIGWLWKEDVGSIHRWVGWQIPDQKTNTWICPSFHPSYCLRALDQLNPVPQMFLETHLKRAVYIKEKPWKEVPDYRKKVRIYFDPSEAARAVRAFVGGQRPIAFDLETDRLKPDHPDARIVSCSVSDGTTTISYPWHGEAIDATLELVQSPLEKIGWNSKFESRWFRARYGVEVQNIVWDGMIAAHVLDCRPGITSLKFQSFVRLGQQSYNDHIEPYLSPEVEGGNNKNRITDIDLRELLVYGGLDAFLEWKVAKHQMKEMEASCK